MRGESAARAALTAGVSATAVVAIGCGGGDEGAASSQPKVSAAVESPRLFATRLAKLLETTRAKGDCPQLEAINGRSAARFECPPSRELSDSMASFEAVGAEAYGTGAVVDYTSGQAEDGAALILRVAPDRNWAVSRIGIVTEPSTETGDEDSRAGFRKAATEYLDAVRARDCRAFDAVAFTGTDGPQETCRTIFPGTKDFARRLKQNPGARPVYQGGNASYGFLTIEMRKPKPMSMTISVMKTPGASGRYLVLSAGQSPTAAQQRETVEQYRRQRKAAPPK